MANAPGRPKEARNSGLLACIDGSFTAQTSIGLGKMDCRPAPAQLLAKPVSSLWFPPAEPRWPRGRRKICSKGDCKSLRLDYKDGGVRRFAASAHTLKFTIALLR